MPAKKPEKKEARPRQVFCANPACFTTLRRLPLREGSSHTVTVRKGKKTYPFCSQFCRDQAGENLEKIEELDKIAAGKRQDTSPPEGAKEEKAKQKKGKKEKEEKAGDEEEGETPPKKTDDEEE